MNTVLMLAVMWKITALDPSHIVVQADRQEDEQTAFVVDDAELAKNPAGWKRDNYLKACAAKAVESRAGFQSSLENGPYTVDGKNIAKFGSWVIANGSQRFLVAGEVAGFRFPRPLYNVYLNLDTPLKQGQKIEIGMPVGDKLSFTYDENVPSPLFKVNQVGYSTAAAARYVYIGGWLGTLGPYPRLSGTAKFQLCDAKSGRTVLEGPVTYRLGDAIRKDGKNGEFETPCTGEETEEMDITAAPAGKYFVRIPGIGRSMDFSVDDNDGVADLFALSMRGLFQQRCGCAKPKELTHWSDDACHMKVYRGYGPPEEWEYKSRLFTPEGKPLGANHFSFNNWQVRQLAKNDPKYPFEELSLPGGWHDAADYDRRPMHMRISSDFALIYLMRPENFTDSQIAVPERGNKIPDILDEAVWGLLHLLRGQQKDGGVATWIEAQRHPGEASHEMASKDSLTYFLTRATRASSMDYAGHAALLARALFKAGDKNSVKRAEAFKKSAIRAFEYAVTAKPRKHVEIKSGWQAENEHDGYYDEVDDPPEAEVLVKAVVNLYALTQDEKYAALLTDEVAKKIVQRVNQKGWSWSAFILAETGITDIPGAPYASIKKFWKDYATKQGNKVYDWVQNAWEYRMPYYPGNAGWFHTMGWGNVHPLHQAKLLIAAHMATNDKKYLDAAFHAIDFHCGCNPNGETWTSGLGKVYPTSYLSLVSCADDIAEYVPGIPPYRNTYGLCPDVSEKCYGWDGKKISKFPILRRWANMEAYSVGASEFTVWETVYDPCCVAGYLMGPGHKPKNDMREPAKDIRDLPGFWCLP